MRIMCQILPGILPGLLVMSVESCIHPEGKVMATITVIPLEDIATVHITRIKNEALRTTRKFLALFESLLANRQLSELNWFAY